MPGQVVRVVNEGDTDFVDMYDSQPYRIPAGGQAFVEYDAICLWLGHPEATNFDPRNRVRVAEYQRLRTRYGVDARSLEMSTAKIAVDNEALFDSMRPRLACYTVEGVPIVTVADDPEGTTLAPSNVETLDNEGLIHARMQTLEHEINNLRSQLAQQQRTEQALNDASPVSSDDLDPEDQPVTVHASGITGTVAVTAPINDQSVGDMSPRSTPRTEPGEDSPTRVRVSG